MISPPPEYDEVRCDRCGQPTPQLDPGVAIELCNACYDVQLQRDVEAHNAAVAEQLARHDPDFAQGIRTFFARTDEKPPCP